MPPTDRSLTALPDKAVKPPRRRQARTHFTQLEQVTQLVAEREADPELGFMARLLALCSLPRTSPGNRKDYIRCKEAAKGLKKRTLPNLYNTRPQGSQTPMRLSIPSQRPGTAGPADIIDNDALRELLRLNVSGGRQLPPA